jgi:lipoprotein-anchoring transpeptidase ErfK/SrfK
VYVLDLLGLVVALGAASPVAPPPTEVVLPAKKSVVVHTAPASRVGVRVGPRTEYGSRLRYAVVERRGRWLGVITPAMPNGRVGWVRASAVRRARYVRERVEIDLSRRLLRVLMDERVVLETRVAVGAAESPTPIGRFAITDKVPGSMLGSVYGCCVLVLSGHQLRPPRGWATADYRLAIHGGDGRTIGTRISAGCVHVRAATLRLLMKRLPVGTPVRIHP